MEIVCIPAQTDSVEGSEAMHGGALWKMENGSNENTNGSYESTKKRRMAQKAADGSRDKAAADE